MRRTHASLPIAFLVCLIPAAQAAEKQADQPTPPPAPSVPPPIELSGSVDVYSGYNFNGTSSGLNEMRAFDTQDGGFALNYAELVIARNRGPVGFRLDAGFGSASDALYLSDPSSKTDSSNARWLSHIQQAYVEAKLPHNVTIDGGKFVTMHGFEVIETKDNWNYSRSLLFSFAIPFLHTGFRATWAPKDEVSVGAAWVNGWNSTIEDGSKMQTGCLMAMYKPRPTVQLILNYMFGEDHLPSQPPAPLTLRNLVDATATWTPTDKLSLAINGDYGHDAAMNGVDWEGVAGYARYQIKPYAATAARFEYLADGDGFMTGKSQHLVEGTLTGELSGTIVKTAVLLRLEYRHDHSDSMVFDATMPTSKQDQDTFLVGAVAAF